MSEEDSEVVPDQSIQTQTKTIAELAPYDSRINVTFKVLEKSEVRTTQNRNQPDEKHNLSDITVGDSTGTIILSAWDSDIELLQVDKVYQLENGYVNIFQKSMRLAKGKFGNIKDSDKTLDVKMDVNRSTEEHQPRHRKFRRRPYANNRKRNWEDH